MKLLGISQVGISTPKFASKMGTYVSRNFFLTTEFACTYLRRQCQNHVRLPKWRESQTTPSWPLPSPTFLLSPSPSSSLLALVAVACSHHPRPHCCHGLLPSSSSSSTLLTKHHRSRRHCPCRPHPLRRCPHAPQALVDRRRPPSCSCPPPTFAAPVAS